MYLNLLKELNKTEIIKGDKGYQGDDGLKGQYGDVGTPGAPVWISVILLLLIWYFILFKIIWILKGLRWSFGH